MRIRSTGGRGLAGALAALSASGAVIVVAGVAVGGAVAGGTTGVLTYIASSRSVLNQNVEVANTDGSDPRTLAPGTAAAVSPDGSSIAVVQSLPPQDNSTSELLVYPESGGRATKLYHCKGYFTVYGWSSDSALLLGSCPHGVNQTGPLLVINAASGAVATIASGVIEGASFAPNPSNDVVYALAASQLLSVPVNLYTASPSGSGTLQLTHGGISTNPLWGPNGIVFARQTSRGHTKAPINQIWSIEADGSGARQLTHMSVDPLAEGLVPVELSANGQHLLANFVGTDQSAAYAVDLSATNVVPRPLVRSENVADAISADGNTVLFTNGFDGDPTSIDSVAFDGGKPTVLARHGARASWNE
jgi:hypothetical protein